MRLLLLADPNSPHTIKWATAMAQNGADVLVFGLGNLTVDSYYSFESIRIVTMDDTVSRNGGVFRKLKYLRALSRVKKLIAEFKPHIVHAHYATSYGLLGALSGFQPLVTSVWGSDVFSFPGRSALHALVLKLNLRKASRILSTSNAMAIETKRYIDAPIEVTPFGIDLASFRAEPATTPFSVGDIVVGTVKTLEDTYGIEYLIRAFQQVRLRQPQLPLKLLIVGGGSLEHSLKQLATELELRDSVVFIGQVPYQDVPRYQNMMSISVFVSKNESFGVAVIEAGACEKPVVVSNVGGLPEVVEDGVTGIVVPPQDVAATSDAIEKLALNAVMRSRMGHAGRERVTRLYDWDANVAQMVNIYREVDATGAAKALKPARELVESTPDVDAA